MDMKSITKVITKLYWIAQLGISTAVPLVLFTLVGVWLHENKGWGGWIVVVGVFVGLFGAVSGFISSVRLLKRLAEEEDKHTPTSFHDHE